MKGTHCSSCLIIPSQNFVLNSKWDNIQHEGKTLFQLSLRFTRITHILVDFYNIMVIFRGFQNIWISHFRSNISGTTYSSWPRQFTSVIAEYFECHQRYSRIFWMSHIGSHIHCLLLIKSPWNKCFNGWENSRGTYNTSTLCLKLGGFQLIILKGDQGILLTAGRRGKWQQKRINWPYVITKGDSTSLTYSNYNLYILLTSIRRI